jgi:hypothetical protein
MDDGVNEKTNQEIKDVRKPHLPTKISQQRTAGAPNSHTYIGGFCSVTNTKTARGSMQQAPNAITGTHQWLHVLGQPNRVFCFLFLLIIMPRRWCRITHPCLKAHPTWSAGENENLPRVELSDRASLVSFCLLLPCCCSHFICPSIYFGTKCNATSWAGTPGREGGFSPGWRGI